MVNLPIDILRKHFEDREFRGTDVQRVLGLQNYYTAGNVIRTMRRQRLIARTNTPSHWRFVNGATPDIAEAVEVQPSTAPVAPTHGPIMRVHKYYINTAAIMLVDTLQADKIVLHTAILEIDGETKHPRNKRLTFTRQHAPEEYRAIMAWLSQCPDAPTAPDDTQAALQLAEEASAALSAAQEEIKDLKDKIATFRKLLD